MVFEFHISVVHLCSGFIHCFFCYFNSKGTTTAVLDIDGKEVTARKIQKRKYKKDGVGYSDDNTYFINEVPKTLKAFNEYFEIDMNLLKMCSSPGAFLNQKTADMRSYLFGLVENVNDLDVAKENAELSAITGLLEKYSADELAAMNKATKSKIDKELPIIDGQIKEKQRDIQLKSDVDVAELELLKNTLSEQLEENIKKQTDAEALEKDLQDKAQGVLDLKFELSGLQRQANDKNTEKIREVQHKINDAKTDYLTDLVQEFYDLSVIENEQVDVECERVDINRIVTDDVKKRAW